MIRIIGQSMNLLLNWLSENGISGYDPYDIKGHKVIIPLIRSGKKFYPVAMIREIVFEFFKMFPKISRKIFAIKPQINAKAMGLLARSYLDLYKNSNNPDFLVKSKECIDWLINDKSDKFGGIGWGYPFDWESNKFIPKFTPNGIVTTAVGDAFWAWYKFSGEVKYLDLCKEICLFLENLPIDRISEDKICFSYTPLFINHVHNLNLFVAEFLIKIGKEVDNKSWVDMGVKATNYTLSNQRDDGSFDYNGPPENPNYYIDNYHTGFILRMLYSIWKLTNNADIYNSIEKCFNHYISDFFEENQIPKLMPKKKYPIDIHSCAESINCLSELSPSFPQGIEIARNVLLWTISHLQDKKGFFYHGIHKSKILKFTFISRIPYIRWSQAWMLRAFSNYIQYAE